mmetsp:Transcript_15378/g.43006  ORF Transcript_15378/g.43006 Transcript_15378/m.43006 type:complete len:213 (-) Transcript_15378:403-1041(-)
MVGTWSGLQKASWPWEAQAPHLHAGPLQTTHPRSSAWRCPHPRSPWSPLERCTLTAPSTGRRPLPPAVLCRWNGTKCWHSRCSTRNLFKQPRLIRKQFWERTRAGVHITDRVAPPAWWAQLWRVCPAPSLLLAVRRTAASPRCCQAPPPLPPACLPLCASRTTGGGRAAKVRSRHCQAAVANLHGAPGTPPPLPLPPPLRRTCVWRALHGRQ